MHLCPQHASVNLTIPHNVINYTVIHKTLITVNKPQNIELLSIDKHLEKLVA